MSEATIFEYPYNLFLKQRLEFVVIVQDHLAASIMRIVEYEMIKLKEAWQDKVTLALEAKKTPPKEPKIYWVRLSQGQIIAKLYRYDSEKLKPPVKEGEEETEEYKAALAEYQAKKALALSKSTLRKAINLLIDLGFLIMRSKPGDEFGAPLYTLNLENVQKSLKTLPKNPFSIFNMWGGVTKFETGGELQNLQVPPENLETGELENVEVGVAESESPQLENSKVFKDIYKDTFSEIGEDISQEGTYGDDASAHHATAFILRHDFNGRSFYYHDLCNQQQDRGCNEGMTFTIMRLENVPQDAQCDICYQPIHAQQASVHIAQDATRNALSENGEDHDTTHPTSHQPADPDSAPRAVVHATQTHAQPAPTDQASRSPLRTAEDAERRSVARRTEASITDNNSHSHSQEEPNGHIVGDAAHLSAHGRGTAGLHRSDGDVAGEHPQTNSRSATSSVRSASQSDTALRGSGHEGDASLQGVAHASDHHTLMADGANTALHSTPATSDQGRGEMGARTSSRGVVRAPSGTDQRETEMAFGARGEAESTRHGRQQASSEAVAPHQGSAQTDATPSLSVGNPVAVGGNSKPVGKGNKAARTSKKAKNASLEPVLPPARPDTDAPFDVKKILAWGDYARQYAFPLSERSNSKSWKAREAACAIAGLGFTEDFFLLLYFNWMKGVKVDLEPLPDNALKSATWPGYTVDLWVFAEHAREEASKYREAKAKRERTERTSNQRDETPIVKVLSPEELERKQASLQRAREAKEAIRQEMAAMAAYNAQFQSIGGAR